MIVTNNFFVIFISAEAETKLKLEKVAEIKKINAQMMLIKRLNHVYNVCFATM